MVKIGSARIDENGNATGGKAGDQTGKEVAIEAFYAHKLGWIVLRAKSTTVAKKIAEAMRRACANANIGYDQSNRESLYAAAMKVGFDPGKVTAACETDCSALVRVCLAYAGIMVGVFNTATEVNVIMMTGKFDKLACSPSTLREGDILVTTTQGHTAIVVDSASPSSTSSVTLSKTVKRIGTVTAGVLNVRVWAGKTYATVKFTSPLKYGTKVGICDTVKAADGQDWYYIELNGHYGFASARYIK